MSVVANKRRDYLYVSLLVIIDQIIKLYIYNNSMDSKFGIIEGYVEFYPMFNRDYSWINSLFQLGIGLLPHIIFSAIVSIGLILVYDFVKTNKQLSNPLNLTFIIIISASICSLIDKIFWGGSLDYIYLVGFFIFDLKDVYVSVFEILLIIYTIKNYKRIKSMDEKKLFKEYWSFVKKKYLRIGK